MKRFIFLTSLVVLLFGVILWKRADIFSFQSRASGAGFPSANSRYQSGVLLLANKAKKSCKVSGRNVVVESYLDQRCVLGVFRVRESKANQMVLQGEEGSFEKRSNLRNYAHARGQFLEYFCDSDDSSVSTMHLLPCGKWFTIQAVSQKL